MMARAPEARRSWAAIMLSGVYRFPPMDSVIYGRPFADALKEQVEQSGATAVFLLASGTLARETGLVGQIRDALGNRLAGVHARIGAHTPRTDVVDAANAARAAGADLLVTLGGGSVTDAAKMVAFCLGNDVSEPGELDNHKAVVEAICSPGGQPLSEGASCHALKLLGRGLLGVKADPPDLEARLDCQLGAWMSMVGSQTGVPKGASHGIGHVLGGTAAVPHGYTSCVMLPHVLRFNHAVNPDRQALVSAALGRPGDLAADVVAGLIAALGLPQRLRDVDVRTDQLDRIAELSMHDRWIHTNPRKIDGPP